MLSIPKTLYPPFPVPLNVRPGRGIPSLGILPVRIEARRSAGEPSGAAFSAMAGEEI